MIHNAWKVDFNLSLSSFESLVASTRNLIDFAATTTHSVKFLFTSSISVAGRWKGSKVPESVLPDSSVAAGVAGYGASKFVMEHVLAEATKKEIISGTSLRIGQLCGSTATGAWNTTDWVPNIVKSSVTLKCLPQMEGDVAWVPMDIAAQTICDIVASPPSTTLPDVLNIVHPHPTSWASILQAINASLGEPLPIVSFAEWLAKVEASSPGADAHDLENVPAIKLLSLLRGIASQQVVVPIFETAKAEEASETLRLAESIDQKQVGLWIQYWTKQKLLA